MQRRAFLQAVAAVAGAAIGDVPDTDITTQQNRLPELVDRDDDERWSYMTSRNLTNDRSGLVNAELDPLSGSCATARICRIKEGEASHDYRVGSVEYGSLAALTTVLEGI